MKKILIGIVLIFSPLSYSEVVELKIEDIVKKVSNENFLVLENAERVYQRKEKIKYSRASPLPRLNIWNLLKIPALIIDPLAIGDIIQDVAPFLVPANWFKAGQAKHLYLSQQEQYRALWANEVNTAKLLFMSVVRDMKFKKVIASKAIQYQELLDIAESRNTFGEGNIFAYNIIKDRQLALTEDKRNLENLTLAETKDLQYMTGVNSELEISIIEPELPSLEEAKPLEFSKIIFKIIEASPEAKQYEHMFNALSKVKGEILFNILGSSTYSAGNGAFENIPVQDGLGFGTGASLRISKSEGRILKLQLKATIETLKVQANVLVKEYNSLIENFGFTKKRITLAESNYSAMLDHISIGGEIGPLEMTEILDNLYTSKILLLSYRYRFSDLVEKLKRMTFTGDYSKNLNTKVVGIKIKAKAAAKHFSNVKLNLDKLRAEFNLVNLKKYSDSLSLGHKFLIELSKKKSTQKRIRKYLSRNEIESGLCEKLLISEVDFKETNQNCFNSGFNSCPISFSKYKDVKMDFLAQVKKIYSGSSYQRTKCDNYTY